TRAGSARAGSRPLQVIVSKRDELSFASHVGGHVRSHRHFVVMAAVGAAIAQHAVILDLKVHAGAEFADLLVGAIYGLGNRDVALLHQIAVDGDGAEEILVMRAGIALLADDGDHAVVVLAVAIAVLVLDRLDLGGVRRDFDLVTLGAVEVSDHVVAKAVDPVIVHGAVLASDAIPVDRAVGIDVLGDD